MGMIELIEALEKRVATLEAIVEWDNSDDHDEPETTPAQASEFSEISTDEGGYRDPSIPAADGEDTVGPAAHGDDTKVEGSEGEAADADAERERVDGEPEQKETRVDPLTLGRAGFDQVINDLD